MEGVQALPIPGGTAEPLQMAAVTSLHWGHAVGSEHGSVLHRKGSTNPGRNTSVEQLLLLLSRGRDNLVSWGKEEVLVWAPYSTTVCSDLCSSNVIHSFSHQLKIPVV